MPEYEHIKDGRRVERVHTVPGSHEDTRLGVAALDYAGGDGWRRVDFVQPPAPTEPPVMEPQTPATPPENSTEEDDGKDGAARGDSTGHGGNRPRRR